MLVSPFFMVTTLVSFGGLTKGCEALMEICGCQISEAILLQCSKLVAERLAPTIQRIAEHLSAT